MGLFSKKRWIFNKDIKDSQLQHFYYTVDDSSYPPSYQRYQFYQKDDKRYFFHEKREGDHWPLTKEDATITATIELSQQQWQQFLTLIDQGVVIAREESDTCGDRGPWLYLYWENDKGENQQFSFASIQKEKEFVQYCEQLACN